MRYQITSARYCFDEMKVYEQYQGPLEEFGAKISSDIETGNVTILINFATTAELNEFAKLVGCGLYLSCLMDDCIPEIWIKDGYKE